MLQLPRAAIVGKQITMNMKDGLQSRSGPVDLRRSNCETALIILDKLYFSNSLGKEDGLYVSRLGRGDKTTNVTLLRHKTIYLCNQP